MQNSKSQVEKVFQLLNYAPNDLACVRAIAPHGQAKNFTTTLNKLPIEKLEQLNSSRYGIYFAPNGGHKDDEIPFCRAVFIEHDDISIEQQRFLWQKLGLPEPTFQIFTGGKSIHSYWVFYQPVSVDDWRDLQSDLISYTKADRANRNPSRLMRLPGFKHQDTGNLSELVSAVGHRYSFQEIRATIPPQQKPPKVKQSFIPSLMPLTVILAKQHRALIVNGTTEGERNELGYQVACDLIGCEALAQVLGRPTAEPARDLFKRFCNRCNPPLEEREQAEIWKSATRVNPSPCLGLDKIQNCIDSWERRKSKGLNVPEICDHITESVESKCERQAPEVEPESGDDVKAVLDLGTINPPKIFNDSLHIPLSNLASRLGLTVEPLIVCLLPILASRLKAPTRLEIDPATDYTVPPIIWAGLVGDSGTLKTPILRALTSPLEDLQKEVFEDFQAELSVYELELQQWESLTKNARADTPKPKQPALKDLYYSDFTIEAIADSMSHYPGDGYLVHMDELAVFFKSMDAYRGGKGGDRQRWLTSYSGSALKVNRKSSSPIYLDKTSISIVGGIQPSVLEKQVLDDPTSDDGLWARFIWCRLPMTIPPGISDSPRFDLGQLLKGIYHSLNQVEGITYGLSTEAKVLWNHWNQKIGELIRLEPSGILRATYPKLKEMAARIALILHITNAKLESRPIEGKISGGTLNDGIQFTRWLMGQTKTLYCEIGASSDSPESSRILKFVNRFKGCGWIKTRTVRNWWVGKTKPSAIDCRKWMAEIVALGYAVDNELETDNANYQIEIVVHLVHKSLECIQRKASSMDHARSPCLVPIVPVVHPHSTENDQWTKYGLPMDYPVVHAPELCDERVTDKNGLNGLFSLDQKSKTNDMPEGDPDPPPQQTEISEGEVIRDAEDF